MRRKKAYLLLEDGEVYEGLSVGTQGTSSGELCFNTGMTGYQEVYTDPSYYGQIIVHTSVHIGNYGVKQGEDESEAPKIRGVVMQHSSETYSRATAQSSLRDYLCAHNIVAIANIDTRALVRHIIKKGVLNALITTTPRAIDTLNEQLVHTPSMAGQELASQVSTSAAYNFGPLEAATRVAIIDFGIKKSMLQCFMQHNIRGRVFPWNVSFQVLDTYAADGYFLSNGPGDPAAMDEALPTIQALVATHKPLMGICLGHQLLARAFGVDTYKLKYGHRGLNHPIWDEKEQRAIITSQNHGFSVSSASLSKCEALRLTHRHLNDHTVAGLEVIGKPVFSVQFHPESSPGTHDSMYLFEKFARLLKSSKQNIYETYKSHTSQRDSRFERLSNS